MYIVFKLRNAIRYSSVVFIGLVLAGCGMSMKLESVGSIGELTKSIHTGNARDHSADIDVKATDWRIIRETVAGATLPLDDDKPLEWNNVKTGAAGTIGTIRETRSKGRQCRLFETTVNTVGGARQYGGRACRLKTGDWALLNIKPRDEVLDR